jgi:hypothetical protein
VTNLFPMFMKLAGKQCLVVGAGKVGEPKIGGLIDTGASIHVVAIAASSRVREWADAGKIELELRAFTAGDLEGKFLAVVATASNSLNNSSIARRSGAECCATWWMFRSIAISLPRGRAARRPADRDFNRWQESIAGAENSAAAGTAVRRGIRGMGRAARRDQAAHSGQRSRPERKLELLHSLASREAFEAALAKIPELSARS